MKKHVTFNRLLHNDKLMLIVSLVLAIALWAWADYYQDTLRDMTFSNVPVNVSLSKTVTDNGLQIVEGADVKASVKIKGTRADLEKLRDNSIHIEAKTQRVTAPGDHKVVLDIELPATISSKCKVVAVSGPGISLGEDGWYKLGIECKYFKKATFLLSANQVKTPNLSLANKNMMRFGNFEITGDFATKNQVTIYGLDEQVEKVTDVCAVISDSKELSKMGYFTAKLVAYDKKGNKVDGISFLDPSGGEVGVIVPVVVYQTETLTIADENVKNAPTALLDKLKVNPDTIELGELPEKQVLGSYTEDIRENLMVDFDRWLAEKDKPITQTVVMLKEKDDVVQKDGVYLDRAPNQITITLDVEGYMNQTKEIVLSGENVRFACDEGVTAELKSTSLQVVLCGPKEKLDKFDPDKICFEIKATGQAEGEKHKVSVRPELVGHDDMWVYFGTDDDAITYEIEYEIVKDVRAIADAE